MRTFVTAQILVTVLKFPTETMERLDAFGNDHHKDIDLNESDESQDIDVNELCELIL